MPFLPIVVNNISQGIYISIPDVAGVLHEDKIQFYCKPTWLRQCTQKFGPSNIATSYAILGGGMETQIAEA